MKKLLMKKTTQGDPEENMNLQFVNNTSTSLYNEIT